MSVIGVIGANGQVGAELVMILRQWPGIEVVPVCRNRAGSAFLRLNGVECRHGLVSDPAEAPQLIGDCDVIVNLALAPSTLPYAARRLNRALIEQSIVASRPGARIIYSSTTMVYGEPLLGDRVAWPSAYGREKLRCERDVARLCRRHGRSHYVLRFGHVCGQLQNLSLGMIAQIEAGTVCLPREDTPSDSVQMATIVDAVLKIAAGREPPGTYDLVSRPQWTWRMVYEHEARRAGLQLDLREIEVGVHGASALSLSGALRSAMRAVAANPKLKETGLQLLSAMSPTLNQRLRATNYQNRANAEIAALHPHALAREPSPKSLLRGPFLSSLEPTESIVDRPEYRLPADASRTGP